MQRRSGAGCRGDDLPAGSAARLSGGRECHVPSATRRSGAGGTRQAGIIAEPGRTSLIALRHGLFAERRDPRRGHGRLPRPAGKSSDGGPRAAGRRRGLAAGGGGPDGPFPEAARPESARERTAGASVAEAGSRGRSHPVSPDRCRPGVPLVRRTARASDGVRRPRRGATQARGEQPWLLFLLMIFSAPSRLMFSFQS